MTDSPEARVDRGVYDDAVDAHVTDEMRALAHESHAAAIEDARARIGRQIETLCGDDLVSHFAVSDILASMMKLKRQEGNNG